MAVNREAAATFALQGNPRHGWVPLSRTIVRHAKLESTQPLELVPVLLAKLASLPQRPLPPAQIAKLESTLTAT
jgi:hypothetical protein